MIDMLYLIPFKILNICKWVTKKIITYKLLSILIVLLAYICIIGMFFAESFALVRFLMFFFILLTTPLIFVLNFVTIDSFKKSLKEITLKTIMHTFMKTLTTVFCNFVILNILFIYYLKKVLKYTWIDIISFILIEINLLFLFYMLLYICYHLSHYTKTISLQIKRELSALGMLSTMLTIPLTIINFKSGVICLNITLAFLKYIDFLNEETKYRKQVKKN